MCQLTPNKHIRYYVQMIWFLVTTSYANDNLQRMKQYEEGIECLKKSLEEYKIHNLRIILIENNGLRKTFFDTLGEVFYTKNNSIETPNKGIKELKDILDCIQFYNIRDDDFIVKLTGRYKIQPKSPFMHLLK